MPASSHEPSSDPMETMEPVTDAIQTISDPVETMRPVSVTIQTISDPMEIMEPVSDAIQTTFDSVQTVAEGIKSVSHDVELDRDSTETAGNAMDTALDGPLNPNVNVNISGGDTSDDPMLEDGAVNHEPVNPAQPNIVETGLYGPASEGRPVPSIGEAPSCHAANSPLKPPRKLGSLFSPGERQKLEEDLQKKNAEEGKGHTKEPNARGAVRYSGEEEFADAEDFSEDEVDHAALFADMKKDYEKMKAKGKNTFADDVEFMKAEKAEQARLKRLENESLREAAAAASAASVPVLNRDDELQDDGDTLFVTEGPPRQSTNMEPDAVEEDVEMDIVGTQQRNVPKKAARGKHRVRKADAEASMRAGIEADIAKDEKMKKRSSRKTSGTKAKTVKAKAVQKKVRDPKAKVTKTARKKPKGKTAKKPNKTLNLAGLGGGTGYNLYDAANANTDKAGLGDVSEKKKADQLKALIASVPETDMRSAKADQKLINEATKKLYKHNVRPAPGGTWKMKGMKLSIKNHQVLGAAWMKDRETGTDLPLGGLLADEMGMGKTVQTITTMLANPPLPGDPSKTTLIVASPSISRQWIEEFDKFAEDGPKGLVVMHQGKSRLEGPGALQMLQLADVVVTTYWDVLNSYPKYKPPKELVSTEQKQEWWTKYFEENKGVLHRMKFYRVILDEATAIKNHLSRTSVACRGLIAKHRWAITGTPIHNSLEELYPYFKFLQVRHIGSFEVFKENFCDREDPTTNKRLHSFLRLVMMRRTHQDELLHKPIIQLPRNYQKTVEIDFNEVERKLYEFVRLRFMQRINSYHKDGTMKKKTNNILTMLLRLRQLTAHPFLVQQTIEDIFTEEDINTLWDTTRSEVEPDSLERKIVNQMHKIVLERKLKNESAAKTAQDPSITREELEARAAADMDGGQVVFKFRKFLRGLREKSAWDDLTRRSWCHRCSDRPDDPHVTTCMHVYCKECLEMMDSEAKILGQAEAACLECGQRFLLRKALQSPCEGLRELGWDNVQAGSSGESQDSDQSGASEGGTKKKKYPDKWIQYNGHVLQSSKARAVAAQVSMWLAENPAAKIIIFTQFQMMINVISRLCGEKGWRYCQYHGKMSHDGRSKAIKTFQEDEEKQILIASLKAGGIGLNLTMASRVICIDLWWNSAIERQAFCRVFRIGQTEETYITRFVVKNSIDEKLEKMQVHKSEIVDEAMGDDDKQRPGKFSLKELLQLFGPVGEDEGQKPFILVDDDAEYADNGGAPPILPGQDESVGHPPRRWGFRT